MLSTILKAKLLLVPCRRNMLISERQKKMGS